MREIPIERIGGLVFEPGSTLLMYAFDRPVFLGRYGLTPEAARRIFAPHFAMAEVKHSVNRHTRSAAWYRFTRQ